MTSSKQAIKLHYLSRLGYQVVAFKQSVIVRVRRPNSGAVVGIIIMFSEVWHQRFARIVSAAGKGLCGCRVVVLSTCV